MNGGGASQMSPFRRFKYAVGLAVAVVGCAVIVDMVFRVDIGEFIFSWVFFAPLLIAGYLAAPTLAKLVPYSRWGVK